MQGQTVNLSNIFSILNQSSGTSNSTILNLQNSLQTANSNISQLTNQYSSLNTNLQNNTTNINNQIDSILSTLNSQAYLNETNVVMVEKFGAKGNGSADDSAAFNDAAQYLESRGGGTILATQVYYIGSNINLPSFVDIRGHFNSAMTRYNTGTFISSASCLIINPNAYISGGSTSGLYGLLCFQSEFPTNGNSTTTPSFQGVAFQVGSSSSSQGFVNSYASNCGFIGFNMGVATYNTGRVIVDNLTTLCNTAVQITSCYDIARVNRVHQNFYIWNNDWSHPEGPFIYINGGESSWQHITNCFTYGSIQGFVENNSGNNVYTNCGCDGNFPAAGGPSGLGGAFIRNGKDYGPGMYIGCQTTGNFGFVTNTDSYTSTPPWPQMQVIGGQGWGPSTSNAFLAYPYNWIDANGFLLQSGGMAPGVIESNAYFTAIGGTPLNFGNQAGTYTQMYLSPGSTNWTVNTNA